MKIEYVPNNEEKISPLTITAKSLISSNAITRTNNRQYSKAHT